jgi:hypothetical protein
MRSDFTVDALLVLSATGCVVDGATVFAIVVTTEGATDVLELELVVEELELLEELDAVVDGAVVDGAVVDGRVVVAAVVVGAVVVGAVVVGRAFIYKTAIAVSLLF